MMRRLAILALLAAVLFVSGCHTWSVNEETEDIRYAEFLEEGKGNPVAVAAFAHKTGLERNRWRRRKVFMAVSGSLFGLVPWPWDLRLVWSPPTIASETDFGEQEYDEDLASAIAEQIKALGFRTKSLPPPEEGITVEDLLASAKELKCHALYVVTYNEFTKLRFRHKIHRHQGFLQHRIKTLEGSALIPSVAMFMIEDGERVMSRSNTGRRGQPLRENFYQAIATFGRASPFAGGAGSIERFLNKVSSVDIEEARERCAEFLADRDFTPKPIEGEEEEDLEEEDLEEEDPEEEEPGEEAPGEEAPGEEEPGEEEPGEEEPGEEEPGEEEPGEEEPGEEEPGEEEPGEEEPGEEEPGGEEPGEDKPEEGGRG